MQESIPMYLFSNTIVIPQEARKEAQTIDRIDRVFPKKPPEFVVDMIWKDDRSVSIPPGQLDRVRDAVQEVFDRGLNIESGKFDYEYGSERGTHDPGPEISIAGSVNVLVRHRGDITPDIREEIELGTYVVDLLVGEIGAAGREKAEGYTLGVYGNLLDTQPDSTLIELGWE
jgi:hypothetical protein